MKDNLTRKMLSFRRLNFGILAIAYFLVYFHRISLSVVADDIAKDFDTTASILGMLGSIYFYCYAAMQFPAGLFSDSIGPRKTGTVSLLLACTGSVLFGLSPNITVAIIARIMVGLGVSMVFIPTMKILSQWFRTDEFAMMTGIINTVGGIGVLAATWMLGISAANFGWRTSFQMIGAGTLLLIILTWLIVRDRPADKGWPSINELDGTDNSGKLLANGEYTFEVQAADANGRDIRATTFFSGMVDKVTFENSTSYLISGNHKIALGDVIEVAVSGKSNDIDSADSESTVSDTQSSNPSINGGY